MSKFSFHKTLVIRGGMNEIFVKETFVMDDYGFLVRAHWGRVNHFLAPLH